MIVHDGASIDAIVAVRAWRYHATQGAVTLTSMFNGSCVWSPGLVKQAECQCSKRALAPWRTRGVLHTCGIYAWRDVEDGDPMPDLRWYVSPLFVHGEVYLWGDVRCHQRGYRASHALIGAIYVTDAMRESTRMQAHMTAEHYGVPLVRRDIISLAGRSTW